MNFKTAMISCDVCNHKVPVQCIPEGGDRGFVRLPEGWGLRIIDIESTIYLCDECLDRRFYDNAHPGV